MGNHYFDFKAFRVQQENAAMKVCTDSCLFGAWTGEILSRNLQLPSKILDIGTGTGLLSLINAQRVPAEIHAVEIDEDSIKDALINFAHSPWKHRLHLHHTSIQAFANEHPLQFDGVICNPPFFSASLRSPHKSKNLSKHEDNLSLKELISCMKMVLTETGLGFVLLPAGRENAFQKILNAEMVNVNEVLAVRQTPSHAPFRYFYCVSKGYSGSAVCSEMSIRDNDNGYTKQFSAMLKQYYLAL